LRGDASVRVGKRKRLHSLDRPDGCKHEPKGLAERDEMAEQMWPQEDLRCRYRMSS
jgi:hypothetical protein